jgi:trypsin-like peptidase
MSDFENSSYDLPIFDVVFSVGGFTKDKFYVSGTAVVVAPFLAITAKHVVEDYMNRILGMDIYKGTQNVSSKTVEAHMELVATQYRDKGQKVNIWRVENVYICLQTDIAFLHLTPSNKEAFDYKWTCCRINLNPPKIGDDIVGYGFHSSVSDMTKINGRTELSWHDQPATTHGKVTDYYPIQRDSSRINFPCFQTDARFDGGMSGGPIFNTSREIIGLICSSLPATEEFPEHVSYVALIWPTMITQISLPYKDLVNDIPYPALTLAERGIISAKGFEKVVIENSLGGNWYDKVAFKKDD